MNRDDIKIVEFGMDDEPRAKSRPAESEAMKIVEFDDAREDHRQKVVTGADVGHIKIVEFDNDPPKAQPKTTENPRAAVGPVKIVEFDEDSEAIGTAGGAPRIKIMEFD